MQFLKTKTLKHRTVHFIPVLILLLAMTGCGVPWTKAITYGEVKPVSYKDSVATETIRDLIFIPVTIEGQTYRFLFDTGAPLSISEELQATFRFKQVSKGHIVDSDHNRKAVSWVRVNAIGIGGVTFTGQTAFVGDFRKNPVLNCLEVDGIIGGNLLRQGNWSIDSENDMLHLYSFDKTPYKMHLTNIPFTSDRQYNMFISLPVGEATVKNTLVDYGSNGSVALEAPIFTVLKERGILGNTSTESGFNQSGIVGKAVPLDREVTRSDSVKLGDLVMQDVIIRTGPTTSIGNGILSRFRVDIDWQEHKLYLEPRKTNKSATPPAGFRLGFDPQRGAFVQAVNDHSDAYKSGLRPMLRVLKIDGISLDTEVGYCKYVTHNAGDTIYLEWIDASNKKQQATLQRMNFND